MGLFATTIVLEYSSTRVPQGLGTRVLVLIVYVNEGLISVEVAAKCMEWTIYLLIVYVNEDFFVINLNHAIQQSVSILIN